MIYSKISISFQEYKGYRIPKSLDLFNYLLLFLLIFYLKIPKNNNNNLFIFISRHRLIQGAREILERN